MKSRVVDTSVVAAAFFPETHSRAARNLLVGSDALLAPDLIYCEMANVIWKRWRRHEISAAEAEELLADFRSLPLRIVPSAGLVELALPLAIQTGRTVYDCLFLALAMREKTIMVSGDQRLVNALAGSPIGRHIAWIGDYG
jgi:predicted nucleic acid-binding protein